MNRKLKKSQFAISSHSEDGGSEIHLYNTLRDHLLVIDQRSEDEAIDALLKKVNGDAALNENERVAVEILLNMGIFVSAEEDEDQSFETWYDEVLHGDNDSLVLHIATTMACNMRCEYCMQDIQPDRSQFMSHDTALAITSWLKHKIISKGIKRLSLIFFGGEPLLNASAIEEISKDMKDFCDAGAIAFKAGAITNGTLLTQEMTDILADAGLSWVKVTLDGSASLHDKQRHLANGSGTFDIIWENLEHAAERLEIFIGGNFSEGDEESFRLLSQKLALVPWRESLVDVRFKPIMKREGNGTAIVNNGCDHGAFTQEQVDRMLEYRRMIKQAGLPQIDDPNVGPCDFYRHNVLSAGVDGSLYPCSGFIGIKDFVIGSVMDDESTEIGERIKTLHSWCDACKGCPFLPLCAGGCRLPAYLAGKDLKTTICDKDFYERIVPYLVAGFRSKHRSAAKQSSIYA